MTLKGSAPTIASIILAFMIFGFIPGLATAEVNYDGICPKGSLMMPPTPGGYQGCSVTADSWIELFEAAKEGAGIVGHAVGGLIAKPITRQPAPLPLDISELPAEKQRTFADLYKNCDKLAKLSVEQDKLQKSWDCGFDDWPGKHEVYFQRCLQYWHYDDGRLILSSFNKRCSALESCGSALVQAAGAKSSALSISYCKID